MHDSAMVTTAADIARIALHASGMPLIMEISSAPGFELPPTNMTADARNYFTRNHFVSRVQMTRHFYEGARGMNVGSTLESGWTLVTVAGRPNNLTYLCVIMGATSTYSAALGADIVNSFDDARQLLDWAFAIYSYRSILRRGQHTWTVGIELAANNDEITLVPDEDIRLLLPQNVNTDTEIDRIVTFHEDRLFAPINQGDVLGEITLMYRGEVVGRAQLLAASDVERSEVLHVLDQIRAIVSRPWFMASVIIFIVMCAVYIGITLLRRTRRERKRFF
jgi:D-alanyl-D-alanine carboxypeptidase (penicillin-binding protein 5/6)